MLLASGSTDGNTRVLDMATGAEVAKPAPERVTDVGFSPDGKLLAIGAQNEVYLWQLPTRRKLAALRHPVVFNKVAFSPDGRLLSTTTSASKVVKVVGSKDVRLCDVASWKMLASFPHGGDGAANAVFSPDGSLRATSEWDELKLWCLPSFQGR